MMSLEAVALAFTLTLAASWLSALTEFFVDAFTDRRVDQRRLVGEGRRVECLFAQGVVEQGVVFGRRAQIELRFDREFRRCFLVVDIGAHGNENPMARISHLCRHIGANIADASVVSFMRASGSVQCPVPAERPAYGSG